MYEETAQLWIFFTFIVTCQKYLSWQESLSTVVLTSNGNHWFGQTFSYRKRQTQYTQYNAKNLAMPNAHDR